MYKEGSTFKIREAHQPEPSQSTWKKCNQDVSSSQVYSVFRNSFWEGQHCILANKLKLCGTCLPFGHWCLSLLLHFISSCLSLCLSKQWKIAQVLGSLHPFRKPWRSTSFLTWDQPSSTSCFHFRRTNGWKITLPLCASLCQ